MITKAGHELIAKYLLGQAPSYASYISFGCGADMETPLLPEQILEKTELNFELMRVPISSKAYFADPVMNGNIAIDERKIISLVGQLPFDSGMSINEVAVWSDSSNVLANSDSRMICSFTDKENWMWKNSATGRDSPEYISNALSGLLVTQENGNIDSSLPSVFACSNQNPTLISGNRMDEGQGTRYLNRNIMMGNGTQTIFIEGKSVDLSSNSSKDELRFAFAMYPNLGIYDSNAAGFGNIDLKITFMKEPDNPETAATIDLSGQYFGYYNIAKAPLNTLNYGAAFTWKQVQMIEIEANTPADWYFAPDALRFDNVSTLNPLYKMTGYTQVLTDDGLSHGAIMEHKSGTNSYAEFRFEIGAD